MKISIVQCLTAVVFLFPPGLSGCIIQDHAPNIETPVENSPTENNSKTPPMEDPSGWSEITINSRYAKTTIDIVGHFEISRNACFKAENGAIALEDWTILSRGINKAVKSDPLAEAECFAPPDVPFSLDDKAEVKLSDQKTRMLFEFKGGSLCTSINNAALARDLLDVINRILRAAMLESCPNGAPY